MEPEPRVMTPPRPVAPRTQVGLLVGGWVWLTGWMIVGMGTLAIVVVALVLGTDRVVFPFIGPAERVEGTVVRSYQTWSDRIPSRADGRDTATVHTVEYVFTDKKGKKYSGRSAVEVQRPNMARPLYESNPAFEKIPAAGDVLEVDYLPNDPTVSRLVRSRGSDMAATFIMLMFPVVGVVFVLVGLIRGRGRLRLLQCGVVADVQLIGRYPSSFAGRSYMDFPLSRPDGSPYWGMVQLQSVRDPQSGQETTLMRVVPKEIMNTVRRKDRPDRSQPGPTVRLIHPPRKPAKAQLFAELAPPVRTNAAGALEHREPGSLVAAVLAPAVALVLLAVPAVWLVLRFTGG